MRRATLAALLAPVTAAALLVTVPGRPVPDRPASSAQTERVTRSVLGCPAAPSAPGVAAGFSHGLAPVGSQGRDDEGSVSVGEVGASPTPVDADRGRRVRAGGTPAAGVVVLGEGGPARGLFATREDRAGAAEGTLASTACTAPQGEWWFAGAGAGIDHASELFVSNVDEGPAVFDVRIHGATGNVDVAATRGITLAPGESVRLPLVELAPRSDEVTLEVDATRGRVVAAVSDLARSSPGAEEGREWLPAAAPPARDVRLAGVPSRGARHVLLVTNPGEQQALVSLELLGPDGAFVPLGKEEVSVDPDAVVALDLTGEIGADAVAVRLRSEAEVIGTLRSTAGRDHAYAASVGAVTGPTVVAAAGDRSSVQLSGSDDPAEVRITAWTAAGRPASKQDLAVPPGGLVEWQLPQGASYAVVVPRSGDVFAAIVHRGPGTAVEPGHALPLTLSRPVVRPLGQSAS